MDNFPSSPGSLHPRFVRIRLTGTPESIDLASEILCVLGTVGGMNTYPCEEVPGHLRRYFRVQLQPETLLDLGVLLEQPQD